MATTKASNGLNELFHDTLKDISFAEKKILATLPKMAKAAQRPYLQAAFEKHHGETQEYVVRLERVTEEGAEIMEEYKGSPALDAGLLAAALAVEHYEISRYGTMRTWASEFGLAEAVNLLDLTLGEELTLPSWRSTSRPRQPAKNRVDSSSLRAFVVKSPRLARGASHYEMH